MITSDTTPRPEIYATAQITNASLLDDAIVDASAGEPWHFRVARELDR
jgi:hypothetical protein